MRGSAAFRAAVAPGGVLAGPWVKNELWRRAKAVPSLDLRFAENKSLVDATTGAQLVTFTRASSGTYVDSQGTIRTAVTNLLLRSDDLTTTWIQFGTTVSSNTATAPDGTLTADKLIDTANNIEHGIYQNTTTSGSHTFSVFAKAVERRYVVLRKDSSPLIAVFDLQTGTVTQTDAGVTASITAYPNGWYRCSMTCTSTGNSVIKLSDVATGVLSNSTYLGNGGGVLLWGAQLEQSSTVGEYIPTTSTINSAPRFDHNPVTGESLGLLVEEQRTNSIRNNTMVGAVAGTPGTNPTNWTYVTTQSNGLTQSVVGTGIENGVNYIDYRFNGTTVATPLDIAFGFDSGAAATGQTWTESLYLRLSSGSLAGITNWRIGLIENTSGGAFVAGALYAVTAPTSASLISQRLSATRTFSGGATVGLAQGTLSISVSGNTAIDFTLRIGLPQLEQGAFATSVIQTSTAAVTRSADVASITGTAFSSWYRQDEGTVFADALIAGASAEAGIMGLTNAGETDFLRLSRLNTTSRPRALVFDNSSSQSDTQPTNTITVGQQFRVATVLKENDFATVLSGGALSTDTSGTMPTVDRMTIGTGAFLTQLNGTIRRLVFWPRRLGNEVLQEVTR
jgi:hypothetical protein